MVTEQAGELKKLAAIASDLGLSAKLRADAMETLGRIGSREAFLVLLKIAANEGLVKRERELALKQAREILKSSH